MKNSVLEDPGKYNWSVIKKHIHLGIDFVNLLEENELNIFKPEIRQPNMSFKIAESFTQKVLIPFRLVPKDGLTAEKLALSITIGIISGIFPVIGMTTILSLFLTMLFRQNLLVVQSVQWILALFQVLLIIPFMQFGAYLLSQDAHITIVQINHAFHNGMISGIKTVGIFHLYAILTWVILAIPAAAVSYFSFLAVFQKKK
jgi:uncharacterized protein (DUF2062 family)